MASWIEIDRVRKDPAAFKPLAKRLLKDPSFERSEFADDFLEDAIDLMDGFGRAFGFGAIAVAGMIDGKDIAHQ